VKAVKKAVRIMKQMSAINQMTGVEAEFDEEYGSKLSVTDTNKKRVFTLLSAAEFLKLDVEKAKQEGGTYSNLLATLTAKKTTEANKTEAFVEFLQERGTAGIPLDVLQKLEELDLVKLVTSEATMVPNFPVKDTTTKHIPPPKKSGLRVMA
jgi:hypothetical protein